MNIFQGGGEMSHGLVVLDTSRCAEESVVYVNIVNIMPGRLIV